MRQNVPYLQRCLRQHTVGKGSIASSCHLQSALAASNHRSLQRKNCYLWNILKLERCTTRCALYQKLKRSQM